MCAYISKTYCIKLMVGKEEGRKKTKGLKERQGKREKEGGRDDGREGGGKKERNGRAEGRTGRGRRRKREGESVYIFLEHIALS